MRLLWWTGLVVIALGIVRTVGLVIRGIVSGDAATVAINVALTACEVVFVVVLLRVRDQLRTPR